MFTDATKSKLSCDSSVVFPDPKIHIINQSQHVFSNGNLVPVGPVKMINSPPRNPLMILLSLDMD
jgi:hypothetical protein